VLMGITVSEETLVNQDPPELMVWPD